MSDFQSPEQKRLSPLVINWHITEACNYRCKFCYAHWQNETKDRELFHDAEMAQRLLQMVHAHFMSDSPLNPLAGRIAYRGIRLNLAGGEPFLYPERCIHLIGMARAIGFEVSVITNASRLSSDHMRELALQLSLLGISVDSTDALTNQAIGRQENVVTPLTLDDLAGKIAIARSVSPRLNLKINTVVNAENWREDFSVFLRQIQPNRWKVLRMLPVHTNELDITAGKFEAFIGRHRAFHDIMCIENNFDMRHSYIMVDPHGRFFQNRLDQPGLDYSAPILEVGAAEAFRQVAFSEKKFVNRYAPLGPPEAA
jgi:radical S-adenosyl methionine domain-containing protein 2